MWVVVQITPLKPMRALPDVHFTLSAALEARQAAVTAFANTGCVFQVHALEEAR